MKSSIAEEMLEELKDENCPFCEHKFSEHTSNDIDHNAIYCMHVLRTFSSTFPSVDLCNCRILQAAYVERI